MGKLSLEASQHANSVMVFPCLWHLQHLHHHINDYTVCTVIICQVIGSVIANVNYISLRHVYELRCFGVGAPEVLTCDKSMG